jgi:hypothetical protein
MYDVQSGWFDHTQYMGTRRNIGVNQVWVCKWNTEGVIRVL